MMNTCDVVFLLSWGQIFAAVPEPASFVPSDDLWLSCPWSCIKTGVTPQRAPVSSFSTTKGGLGGVGLAQEVREG